MVSEESLEPVTRTVTARDIVMGAAASRDWQPQHHDHAHAKAMGLPGIIMNAPTQTGWFHAFALERVGQAARVCRWKLTMHQPVCPDDEVQLSGAIEHRESADDGGEWIWISLAMTRGETQHSEMKLLLFISCNTGGVAFGSACQGLTPPPLAPIKQNC